MPEVQGELHDAGPDGGQGVQPRVGRLLAGRRHGDSGSRPVAPKSAPYRADGYLGRFDNVGPPRRPLGPGDSNYEMTFAIDDTPRDGDVDWDKDGEALFEPEAPSSDEIEAVIPKGPEMPRSEPWLYGFLARWGRPLCFGVIGFVVLSVLVIGFLVASSLGMAGIQAIPASLQTLIVASVGTIALLLIGLAMVFQCVFLADLVRSVQGRIEHQNRLSGR